AGSGVGGTVSNTGVISSENGPAVLIDGDIAGDFINAQVNSQTIGTISAVHGLAVQISGTVAGNLTNTGVINATAGGILVSGVTGNVTYGGTITATNGDGIHVQNDVGGSATIASGTTIHNTAYGVAIGSGGGNH